MAEPTEHGLVLHLNLPVRKQATGGRVDLDLSQVDRTRFIETRAEGELPSTTVDVQRDMYQMGWFTAQGFLGHPTHPLSYLGLNEDDTMRELGTNQIGNLVRAYSGDDGWFYDSGSEHREGDIHIRGTGGDFLRCAEKRAEEDDDRDPDDYLLIWEAHPHIERGVREALIEYDPDYKDQFTDRP